MAYENGDKKHMIQKRQALARPLLHVLWWTLLGALAFVCVFVTFGFVASKTVAVSTVPTTMSFQGRLTNSSGLPMASGTYNMTFRIYDAASGGTLKWSEVHAVSASTGVVVTNGMFSEQLGSVISLPATLYNTSGLYLEVELTTPAKATCSGAGCAVWTEGPMTPRSPLATSAYSFNSETLDGLDSSAFAQLSANNTFTGTLTAKPLAGNDSASYLRVQNANGYNVLTVDTTSGGQVVLGQALQNSGAISLYNSTNSNTVSLKTGTTASSFTITLPSAIGSTGQCLTVANVVGSVQTLGYGTCGGGGGGSAGPQKVTLAPEFAGAIFSADGSNNTGFMTSDRVTSLNNVNNQGYNHNFYAWSTDQATAQDYDIVAEYQLPSSFTSFEAGSWSAWVYVNDNANNSVAYTIYDATGDSCSSGTLIPSANGTWQQMAMSDPSTSAPCSFGGGDIISIDFKLTAKTSATNYVKLGELQFGYN
jgi:hypothetical protein